MEIFVNPPKEQWAELMARMSVNDDDIAAIVSDILRKVKEGGDAAIRQIATEVEGFCPVMPQDNPVSLSNTRWVQLPQSLLIFP